VKTSLIVWIRRYFCSINLPILQNLDSLIELDKELLLFFNGFHAPWLDTVMLWATETFFWTPLYAVLLWLIIKVHKWNAIPILIGIAITITLSDQITSSLMKPFFARPRPSHEPSLSGLLHLVNGYKGGVYGFASSHAANTFGVAFFIYLLFRKRYAWAPAIFLWAISASYTRIYLGVHYPGDIFAGALVGTACGLFAYFCTQQVKKRFINP